MSIAYDNASHSGFLNTTSNDLTHVTAGSNRGLAVFVYASTNNITGATYNGVSMTAVQNLLMTGGAAGQYLYEYYLANPATGSNTVTVSSSSGMGGYISAVSYTGTKQTGQPDASNTGGSASTTSLTTSVTTVDDNCWLVGYAYHNGTVVAGTDTTLRGGSLNVLQAFDSNAAKTPAGSHSVNTTRSPADFAGHVMMSISPVAAGGGFTPTPLMHMQLMASGMV